MDQPQNCLNFGTLGLWLRLQLMLKLGLARTYTVLSVDCFFSYLYVAVKCKSLFTVEEYDAKK